MKRLSVTLALLAIEYCKFQGLCFCHDTRCDVNGDPITPDKPVAPPKMQPLPGAKKGTPKQDKGNGN